MGGGGGCGLLQVVGMDCFKSGLQKSRRQMRRTCNLQTEPASQLPNLGDLVSHKFERDRDKRKKRADPLLERSVIVCHRCLGLICKRGLFVSFLNFLNVVYSKNVADPIFKKCVLVFKLTPTATKNHKNQTLSNLRMHSTRERPVMQHFFFLSQSSCQDQLAFMLLAHK